MKLTSAAAQVCFQKPRLWIEKWPEWLSLLLHKQLITNNELILHRFHPNHPTHCCRGHGQSSLQHALSRKSQSRAITFKLLSFSCEMVAGVKVKPPPETRRCSSAGGGSQRRFSSQGKEWSSAISARAHRHIVGTLHRLYPWIPQNLDKENFSPLQPWSQPWIISQNVTRSSGHVPPFATRFFHFCIFSLLHLLSSQSSVIDLSQGGRNQPQPLFLDIQPRAQTQPGIWE